MTLLPITSRERDLASRVRIPAGDGGLEMVSFIKCEEVRTVSRGRVIKRLGKPNPKYLQQAMTQVRAFLGLRPAKLAPTTLRDFASSREPHASPPDHPASPLQPTSVTPS